jgi:hypothetical protein
MCKINSYARSDPHQANVPVTKGVKQVANDRFMGRQIRPRYVEGCVHRGADGAVHSSSRPGRNCQSTQNDDQQHGRDRPLAVRNRSAAHNPKRSAVNSKSSRSRSPMPYSMPPVARRTAPRSPRKPAPALQAGGAADRPHGYRRPVCGTAAARAPTVRCASSARCPTRRA